MSVVDFPVNYGSFSFDGVLVEVIEVETLLEFGVAEILIFFEDKNKFEILAPSSLLSGLDTFKVSEDDFVKRSDFLDCNLAIFQYLEPVSRERIQGFALRNFLGLFLSDEIGDFQVVKSFFFVK